MPTIRPVVSILQILILCAWVSLPNTGAMGCFGGTAGKDGGESSAEDLWQPGDDGSVGNDGESNMDPIEGEPCPDSCTPGSTQCTSRHQFEACAANLGQCPIPVSFPCAGGANCYADQDTCISAWQRFPPENCFLECEDLCVPGVRTCLDPYSYTICAVGTGNCGTPVVRSCSNGANCFTDFDQCTQWGSLEDGCGVFDVWNGSFCRPITYVCGTAIVGLDSPVDSREELNQIELSFAKRYFHNFPEDLVKPQTESQGQQLQDLRLATVGYLGSNQERTWEILIDQSALQTLDAAPDQIGGTAIQMLVRQPVAENIILKHSLPDIQRRVALKRIIIVSDSVYSSGGGGWEPLNDTSYSYWANDRLNGVPGDMPYDIDSRWCFPDTWASWILSNGGFFWGIKIDFDALHELTHHLPIGDNYSYNPGQGNGFSVLQQNGKVADFPWYSVNFMENDHMMASGNRYLTAPSSYYILFNWKKNPSLTRAPQHRPYPEQYVYGNFFFKQLLVKISGLETAGIEACSYLREDPNASDHVLVQSDARRSIDFGGGVCTLDLSDSDQSAAFPGGYIGLQRGDIVFPVFIPLNLMQTFYWASSETEESHTFELTAQQGLTSALSEYQGLLDAGSGTVDLGSKIYRAFMATYTGSEIDPDTILIGDIDNLGNRYFVAWSENNL